MNRAEPLSVAHISSHSYRCRPVEPLGDPGSAGGAMGIRSLAFRRCQPRSFVSNGDESRAAQLASGCCGCRPLELSG